MNSDKIFATLSSTQRKFLSLAMQKKVNFIIVGGYAVRFHGHLRRAKDLDLLLQREKKNADKIYTVLTELGANNIDQAKDFATGVWKKITWYDVDMLTSLLGASYEGLYNNCCEAKIDNISVVVISKNDLIEIKKRALNDPGQKGRKNIDLSDLKALIGKV